MNSAPGFRTVALIIASAMFMEQLDGTILATALPAMAESFDVSPLHMSVALTSYMLSLAVFIPASGAIADRYGSRNVFRAAIALFTVGSILCGLAGSLPLLVLSRLLQGIGGAMMVPVGRLVLLRSVPKSELVSAMSWLLVPALIGPVVGPPLGGFIVTWVSWRWIFYINVPIGIVGMWLATKFIPDIRIPDKVRFDKLGFVLSGVSLSCLVFGLEMASRGVTSVFGSTGLIVGGLVVGAVYVWHSRRVSNPILDLSLMRFTTFRLSVIAGSLTRITAGSVPFLLPLMMQLGFGMSAAHSGVVTFVSALGAMLMKATAAPVLRWWGFRATLVWNGVLSMVCVALCAAFRPDWPLWIIYAVLLLSGFFQSLQFSAYNTVAYADVPSERFSSATSFYTTFQQLMLSLGICVGAASLHLGMTGSGHRTPQLSDFTLAFLVVTAVSAMATIWNRRFAADAGAQLSGHRRQER
ncbi:MAG: MFS transporter [Luteibacter sp.]